MIGAIIGDIVGSRFEFNNNRNKNFELFTSNNYYTDDTVMTLAIAKSILEYKEGAPSLRQQTISNMKEIGRRHFDCGFGQSFAGWIAGDSDLPYNSFGNGAAMRVSGCGFMAKSLREALTMSEIVTATTHNHEESIKAVTALTEAIWMARHRKSKKKIQKKIFDKYYIQPMGLDVIRYTYKFDVTCQGTMPVAFQAFFEADSFEDTIRNAISVGGDSDTIAAIAGSLAEAYYGVPNELKQKALSYLDKDLLNIYRRIEKFEK